MNKINTKVLVEASILSAITAMLIIISYYMPFVGIFGILIWPIPITYLMFKYDFKISVLSLICSLIIAAILIDPITALVMGLLYGISSIILGFCLKKKMSALTTIIIVAISMFISFFVLLAFQMLMTNGKVLSEMERMFNELIAQFKGNLSQFGIDETQIETLIPKDLNFNYVKALIPGTFALSSLMGSFLSYYIVQQIFKRLKININEILTFSDWYINTNISFGIFFTTIVAIILNLAKLNNADIFLNTVVILFNFVFIIDGLAVIDWYIKKKNISKGFRIAIIMFLVISQLANLAFYIGLIDYILDFRKINPRKKRFI